MKGRNGTTSFLPSKGKGGFQRKISELCLMKEQMKQIYDKIELREMVKMRKMDWHNVHISPKKVMSTNDVIQYEKSFIE